MKNWKDTGKQTSRNSRICSISLRNWNWTMKLRFWNVSPIDLTVPSCTRSTLSHDQVIKWTKAKVRVYTDSVLCLEKILNHSQPIEFEWNIFQDLRHWSSSRWSKKTCKNKRMIQNILKDELSSCHCLMTSIGQGNSEMCLSSSEQVKNDGFFSCTLVILRPRTRRKWYGTHSFGMTFLPFKFLGNTCEAEVSKLVMKLVHHYDYHDTRNWWCCWLEKIGPKLRFAFTRQAEATSLIPVGFSISTRKQQDQVPILRKLSRRHSVYSRFSRHAGWNVIAPGIVAHVAIPSRWKEFLSPRMLFWCHYNPQVRIHRWKKSK